MAIKKRVESTDLTVDPETDVSLTITIGNAQIGASVIRLSGDTTVIAKGEIRNLRLGKAAQLKGKVLKVTTNVLDNNSITNHVVVTYDFGACKPATVVFKDELTKDGDIISFLLDFNFK